MLQLHGALHDIFFLCLLCAGVEAEGSVSATQTEQSRGHNGQTQECHRGQKQR